MVKKLKAFATSRGIDLVADRLKFSNLHRFIDEFESEQEADTAEDLGLVAKFIASDKDSSGKLDVAELLVVMHDAMGLAYEEDETPYKKEIHPEQTIVMLRNADENGDGELDLMEYLTYA